MATRNLTYDFLNQKIIFMEFIQNAKYILWDGDGCAFDSEPAHCANMNRWHGVFRLLQISYQEWVEEHVGKPWDLRRHDVAGRCYEKYVKNCKAAGIDCLEKSKYMEVHFGEPEWGQSWMSESYKFYADEAAKGKITVREGVLDAMAYFDALGYQQTLVTNSNEFLASVNVEQVPLVARYFEGRIFDRDMVRDPKPHPALYKLAMNYINVPPDEVIAARHIAATQGKYIAATPDECIAIEDSVSGVEAAVRAGLKVIVFPGDAVLSDASSRVAFNEKLVAIAKKYKAPQDSIYVHWDSNLSTLWRRRDGSVPGIKPASKLVLGA